MKNKEHIKELDNLELEATKMLERLNDLDLKIKKMFKRLDDLEQMVESENNDR